MTIIAFGRLMIELRNLAQNGQPNAMYAYGSELLLLCENNVLSDKRLVKKYLQKAHKYLQKAADKKVHSANYYLGKMYEEAIYVRQDTYKALDYYIEGAAFNNAL